jgi:hypothetical protein
LAELYAQRETIDLEISSLQAKRAAIRAAAGLSRAPAITTSTTLREAILSVCSDGQWRTRDQVCELIQDNYPGQWHASSVGAVLTEHSRNGAMVARPAGLPGEKRSVKAYRIT